MQKDMAIEFSKLAAAFAVVLLHSAAGVVLGAEFGGYSWWVGNALDAGVRWAVPVFVMVSGATLITEKTASEAISAFYRRRIDRIVLPLLVWTLVFIYWPVGKAAASGLDPAWPALSSILDKVLSGRPYYHLWYLYMIIGLYLATPFVSRLVRNLTDRQAVLLAILLFVLSGLLHLPGVDMREAPPIPFMFWFLSYLCYFVAGRLLWQASAPVRPAVLWLALVGCIAITAVGTFVLTGRGGHGNNFYFYDYFSISVIPMSLCAFMILIQTGKRFGHTTVVRALAPAALGIYLVHPVFLETFRLALSPTIPVQGVIYSLSLASLTFAASAIVALFLVRTPGLKRLA